MLNSKAFSLYFAGILSEWQCDRNVFVVICYSRVLRRTESCYCVLMVLLDLGRAVKPLWSTDENKSSAGCKSYSRF